MTRLRKKQNLLQETGSLKKWLNTTSSKDKKRNRKLEN